jgi:tagatose 1,6-diphosphate aldolase
LRYDALVQTSRPFTGFLDPGPLVDGELELVAPEARWVDDVLASCQHLSCIADVCYNTTREELQHFINLAPFGRDGGDALMGRSPAYHFWLRLRPVRGFVPPVPFAGGLGLRLANDDNIRLYIGHVGYGVYPPARGRHLAERATRLVLPLARRHGLRELWITTNPDNAPSRRTCERLGAELVDTVAVPHDHPLYARGDREKCRYRLKL